MHKLTKKISKLTTEGRLEYVMMARKRYVIYLSRLKNQWHLKKIDSCKVMRTLNKQTVHSNMYECVGEMRVNVTVVTFDKYKPKKKSKIWKTNPHNDYVAYAQIFNKWFFHSAFVMLTRNCNGAHTTISCFDRLRSVIFVWFTKKERHRDREEKNSNEY